MPLTTGTKLGPYEITGAIGAGGMGEVYRARDTRLNRDVAIKVLPAIFASDADRLHRFEQEARAVGALNHPNIMAIYDIGENSGAPYIVTELLEGATLRDRLQSGPLPMRKALDYGVQTAAGLAAAHEKGIVHRDLKPENIYITNDGRVKILDFGLAKLSPAQLASGEQTLASQTLLAQSGSGAIPTQPIQTQPGAVLGTVGYMSPEQVRGLPADARSDLFSLGTILYEMVSGNKPFHGDSAVETMNAILKEDPPELRAANRAVPPVLERIIRRCLEKNPGERFQSARDLGFALDATSGASSGSGKAPAGIAPPEKQRKWILPAAAILLIGLAAGFIAAYATFRGPKTPGRISVTPMTFRAECIFNARFAPDGATVVFSAAKEGNVPELFIHRPDYPAPQPLGRTDTQLLAISSKGELAVLTGARFIAHFIFNGTLARMDMSGGAPRNVAQNIQDADWSPDGESLAIIREVNGQSRLEYPIGNVLFETAGYISDMRFSPRGDQIAFFEHPFRYDDRGSVGVVDLKGAKKVLATGYSGMEGIAWSNDGDSIYFGGAANGDTNYLIFAVTLSGKARAVFATTDSLWPYDRDKKGNILATGNSNQEIVNALAPGATSERDVSWLDSSGSPNLSPDGKQLLFTENSSSANSNYSLLLGGTDGSPVARLGEGAALGISPDGQWALSLVPGPPSQIVLNAIGSGEKRVLPRGGIETYSLADYFPDGMRVLVCGNEAGHRSRCYVQDIAGGPPRPITPEGTSGGLVSPDGKSVLAQDSDEKYFMYPVAGGSPVPVTWIGPGETIAQWTTDGRAILVFHKTEIPSRVEKIDLATGRRTLVRILAPADRAGALEIGEISFSADEKAYAYSYVKNISTLALIEGVK
jgi:Tol biopolymer transport system component